MRFIFLFLLAALAAFPFSLTGQSATYAGSAVVQHLQAASGIVPKAGEAVVYSFQSGNALHRQGDGKSSVLQLLESGLDERIRRGACKGVAINNVAITAAPFPNQQASTGTETTPPAKPNKPASLNNEASDPRNTGISLPDSATVARNLQDAKEKVSGWRGRLWSVAGPIWEFVMWIFNSVIVLLICFGGLCRYVAKTAAQESRVNRKGKVVLGSWIAGAHQNASALLLVITWVIAIFFLIDAFMWLVYLDLPVWLLVVLWFPLLWFAEKLTGWIVPNLRGDGGNYPQA